MKCQREEYAKKVTALCSAPLVVCAEEDLPQSTTWKAKMAEPGGNPRLATYSLMFSRDGAMRGFKTDSDGTKTVLGKFDKNQDKALWLEIDRSNIQGDAGDDLECILHGNQESLLAASLETPTVTVCEASFDVTGNDMLSTFAGDFWTSHGDRGMLTLRSGSPHIMKAEVMINVVDIPYAAPLTEELARRYSEENNHSPLRAVTIHHDEEHDPHHPALNAAPRRPPLAATSDPNLFSANEIQRMQALQAQYSVVEMQQQVERRREATLEIEEVSESESKIEIEEVGGIPAANLEEHEPSAPTEPSTPAGHDRC